MSVMCDKVINLAQRQVGYKESPLGSNKTKYGVWFDTPKSKGGPYPWFCGKKNGEMWCAVFVCWLFCQAEILGPDKARTFLGIPKPAENYAAACGWLWTYLSRRKFYTDRKSGQAGDIIFFNTKDSKGKTVECGHVGIIEKVDDSKYYTIEGNKSNQVKRCSYSKTSSSIYGLMRPAWSEIEPKEAEPTPEPLPVPEPVKPQPVIQKYKVKTNTGAPLALRAAPNTKAVCIVWMPNKSEVTVTDFVKGQMIGGCDQWARTTYKGKSGYCLSKYLTKA